MDTSGTGANYFASSSGSASITWAIAFSADTGGVQLATWSGDIAANADVNITNNGLGSAQGSAAASFHLPVEVTGGPVEWTLTAAGGGASVEGRYRGLGTDMNAKISLAGEFSGTLEPGPHNLRIEAFCTGILASVPEGPGGDSAQGSGSFQFTLEFGAP